MIDAFNSPALWEFNLDTFLFLIQAVLFLGLQMELLIDAVVLFLILLMEILFPVFSLSLNGWLTNVNYFFRSTTIIIPVS